MGFLHQRQGLKFLVYFSPVALKARFSFLKAKLKGGFSFQNLAHLEIRAINRVLVFCIFIISMINLNKRLSLEFKAKLAAAPSALPETSLLKVASYYLEKARARDIFKMGLTSVANAQQISKAPISKIAEASQNLKLVGISWSEDLDVIIEDTQAKRAYFLKRGQMINDFEVKAIFKDKVILSYQGEEIELR